MTASIEIGKVSSRGQVAIPAEMRKNLNLREGEKVLFFSEGDAIVMKRVTPGSFREITEPLKEAVKKAGLKESEVTDIISRFRKSRR
ncbi:AbrB/MazE/SpoVT family DNA-binding domain-containing protein [Candidatus Woesearchaeota archaeon]|nr:AbrB/MazE/SpoVT family DNA-binding domain-containing protein [Candidatus Woesearchaeota archaeon]